jgi:ParB family chromosome partitioning protein
VTKPKTQQARELIYRAVDDLKPYAKNARVHSSDQIEAIARSIDAFGFASPILIDERMVILAGHGRALAAQRLGIRNVPTIMLTGLTEAQARAYTIADNQLADLFGWDHGLLKAEMIDLRAAQIDLTLTGFDGAELDEMLAPLLPPEKTRESGKLKVTVECPRCHHHFKAP